MSEFKKRASVLLRAPGLYIALALCVVAAGTIVYLSYLNEEPVQQVVKPAPVIEVTPPVIPPVAPAVPPAVVPKPEPKPSEETVVNDPVELLPQVVSPLDGTTVTVFSMTELMYDDTMEDWRTHNGLDIQAGEGDSVKTAAAGTVTAVENDELMGTSVTVAHAGGYTTKYSSLQENVPVQVGQELCVGDVIGCVGSTAAAESSMGPHLHFSVSRDGLLIDPAEYVK